MVLSKVSDKAAATPCECRNPPAASEWQRRGRSGFDPKTDGAQRHQHHLTVYAIYLKKWLRQWEGRFLKRNRLTFADSRHVIGQIAGIPAFASFALENFQTEAQFVAARH